MVERKAAKTTKFVAVAAIAVGAAVIGWRYYEIGRPQPASPDQASNTTVLGSSGHNVTHAGPIPPPPVPRGSSVATSSIGSRGAVAVWLQNDDVFAATYQPESGWGDIRKMEEIMGGASDLQLAGNGQAAMAVWRHSLGNIESLRYSRFEPATGWSAPDVVAGVLPRRSSATARPRLQIDGSGQVTLEWPSRFADQPMQAARFDPGKGWSTEEVAQR